MPLRIIPKPVFSLELVLPCTGKDLPSCVLIYYEIDTILLEGDLLGTEVNIVPVFTDILL